MTTTAPDRQPSTPAEALYDWRIVIDIDTSELVGSQEKDVLDAIREALEDTGGLDDDSCVIRDGDIDEPDPDDAAPTVYTMPSEPLESELWCSRGIHWRRDGGDTHQGYHFWVNDRGWVLHYPELLMRQYPLSAVPPERTEIGDA